LGGNYGGGGRLLVRSVLDTRKTSSGSATAEASNYHETQYGFEIWRQILHTTQPSVGCANKERSKYGFGEDLVTDGCGWRGQTEQNWQFNGNGSFSGNSTLPSKQTYITLGVNNTGVNYNYWNGTQGYNESAVWNRALGHASTNGALLVTNQASNTNNSIPLAENQARLLGLQAIQSTIVDQTVDTNSNRPQLSTSYRATADMFGSAISTDDKSISGRIARTGQKQHKHK
jgi:hypothetical protein